MTVKPILDTRVARKSGAFPLYIRVQQGKSVKYVPTGYRLEEKYWTGTEVKKTHSLSSVINAMLADKIAEIKSRYAESELKQEPFQLMARKAITYSFSQFLFNQAVAYEKKKMIFKSLRVARMHKEFKETIGDIPASQISPAVAVSLDQRFIDDGNSANTRAKKIKTYREQFNLFLKETGIKVANPFLDFKVPQKKVNKEKLSVEEIEAIEKLKLTGWTDLARDMYLFQFYCKGQRVGVVIMAKWDQIKDGRIYFVQGKNSDAISVKMHPKLQKILNKYKGMGEYIFNLVKKEPKDEHQRIRIISSATTMMNKHLRIIAEKIGTTKKITTHISRHTFASHLMEYTPSIFVIKDALGHSDIRTTQAYTKSLMDNSIDKEVERLYRKK